MRSVAELRDFTGTRGEWRLLPAQSSETLLVYQRGAPAAPAKAPKAAGGGGKKRGRASAEEEDE